MIFDQQVTFLLVEDLDRSAAFYGDVVGLELVLDQGSCRIFRAAPSAFLGVCERPGRASDGVIVTFVTDDVEGTHERLVAAGATCEREPGYSAEYDIVHAFYRDPDGHLVEVQRFCDPSWPAS
ncbi:MAG: VOC family protein [Acidimicrobiia bacterium]|nr:VOC family protein [Acidimicrobiia bacterium]